MTITRGLPMGTRYRHTQPGYFVLGVLAVAFILIAGLLIRNGASLVLLLVPGLLFGLSALFFSHLTIEITEHELTARTGIALVKRVKLANIQAVRAVKNPWWYGWGMHLTPAGWLYNVNGRWAVEVELRSGQRFRLGTDQPMELERALSTVIPARMA
jgi:hypothetical protein